MLLLPADVYGLLYAIFRYAAGMQAEGVAQQVYVRSRCGAQAVRCWQRMRSDIFPLSMPSSFLFLRYTPDIILRLHFPSS